MVLTLKGEKLKEIDKTGNQQTSTRKNKKRRISLCINKKKSNPQTSKESVKNTLDITRPPKGILNIYSDPAIFKLLDFHLNKKEEINKLSEKFNILFYGYGEKRKLLKKLFPLIPFINCIGKTDLDLLQELFESLTKEEIAKSNIYERIQKLKQYCDYRKKYKIVLCNPPVSFMYLIESIKDLTILCTQDKYHFLYTDEYLVRSNLLLIDLTTFIPYEDIEDLAENFEKSVSFDILKVISNIPKRSVNVFKEILKLCEKSDFKRRGFVIQSLPFLELVKEQLLITDFNVINQHLIEFFEHGIIKRVDGGFRCYFTAQDAKDVLSELA